MLSKVKAKPYIQMKLNIAKRNSSFPYTVIPAS